MLTNKALRQYLMNFGSYKCRDAISFLLHSRAEYDIINLAFTDCFFMLYLHQKLRKHRSRVPNASGIRSISYDHYGNLDEERIQVGSLRYTTQEHWDAYGRSTGYVLQKNGNRACGVSQAYGTYGRIAVASFIHANVEHKFHYGYLQGSDLLQTLSMPNGVTLTQEYEEKRNLLTGMDYVRENSLVTQRRYTYNAISRPKTRDTRYPNKGISHNDSFAYNHRSELTGALLDNSAYAYAYDNIGNREIAQEAAEGITYAANELNQYTRISTDGENFSPEYDADGNQTLVQTSTGIWRVTYNAQNRAVKFESVDGSTLITCAYDYMGRRFEKQVTTNGTITTHQRFIYRNYLQIAAVNLKANASTPDQWFLIWDPTQPIATRPLALRKDGVWYTYGWDLTKNICELYGQQGYIRTMYRYTPYGTVTAEGDVTQPIQWSSEVYDPELSLNYYNYRYYNPLNGCWTRKDPIGESVSGNTYCFIGNYITYGVDYLGLIIDTIWDVGNMVWDVGVIIAGVVTGDKDMISDGATDFALDTLAAIIPGVPAGASKAVRISEKAASKSPARVLTSTKKNKKKPSTKKKGMYTCIVSGGMIQLDRSACCDGWVEGIGVHKNREEAKRLAKKDANSKVPRGCQGKHFNTRCTKG